MLEKSDLSKVSFFSFSNVRLLILFSISFVILLMVGYVTLFDIFYWNKDLGFIFFGPRLGEALTLSIGMTLIYYLLIGLVLLSIGIVLFYRKRKHSSYDELVGKDIGKKIRKVNLKQKTGGAKRKPEFKGSFPFPKKDNVDVECVHRFGYLSNRPKGHSIPSECISCSRLGSCMVATVYLKKI